MNKLIFLLATAGFSLATYGADLGHLYPPYSPTETSLEDLPYAIPCAKAKTYSGYEFLRCTWFSVPRNIVSYDENSQQNISYSNHLRGACVNGKCRVRGGNGIYGFLDNVPDFSLSVNYYLHLSDDGLPIAYRMDVGPQHDEKEVSYEEARSMLNEALLEYGIGQESIKDYMSVYNFDAPAPAPAPTITTDVKEAWCNPRADDECTVNGKKVPKASLKQYLPEVYELEVLNAGGYCEYPICYDKNDKPVGIR